jgi:class 3 adenylate cyclase
MERRNGYQNHVGRTMIIDSRGRRTTDKISKLSLFLGVSPTLVAELGDEHWCVFGQGEVLAHQGDPPHHLFVIERGRVQIEADAQILTTRGANEIVGEQAFVEGSSRGATISAIDQVSALRVPHDMMVRLLEDAAFVRNLLRALSVKLSEATRVRAVSYHHEDLLRKEFSAHLSAEATQRLLAIGEDFGRPRIAKGVVLFADIRGFTAHCNGMDPLHVASDLTVYVDRIVDIIHAHGGMVDKFVGDCVMAVWGAMEPQAKRSMAHDAFECAREMAAAAPSLRFGGQAIHLGIGINLGPMFVGNVGGDAKRQFTVLGSTVNLAARYEAETKALGVSIVMGQPVVEHLDAKTRSVLTEHKEIDIKGFGPQTIYSCALQG